MSAIGLKRHKKHQIIIAKHFNRFLKAKELEKYNSDDDDHEKDSNDHDLNEEKKEEGWDWGDEDQ